MVTVAPVAAENGSRWCQTPLTQAGSARTQLRHQQRKLYLRELRHKLQQETAKRTAAEAVMDPASELHKRLQMAAPVVAAGIAYQPQIAIDRMRRNAALHNYSVSADSISRASRSQLNALQRGTLAAPQTADYPLLQAPLSSPLFVDLFGGESDFEVKDYQTCSEATSNVDVCDFVFQLVPHYRSRFLF